MKKQPKDYVTDDGIIHNNHMQHSYWLRLLIAFDQLGNAIVGGSPDETISSATGRAVKEGRANKVQRGLCWFLKKLDNNHCVKNIGQ